MLRLCCVAGGLLETPSRRRIAEQFEESLSNVRDSRRIFLSQLYHSASSGETKQPAPADHYFKRKKRVFSPKFIPGSLHDSPQSSKEEPQYSRPDSFLSRSQSPNHPESTSSFVCEQTESYESTSEDTQSARSGSSAYDYPWRNAGRADLLHSSFRKSASQTGNAAGTDHHSARQCLALDASYTSIGRCKELLASSAAIRRDLEKELSMDFTTPDS